MMTFFNFKRTNNQLFIDSFKENYLPPDPLKVLYDRINDDQNSCELKTGNDLKIGLFDPGEKMKTVRKKLDSGFVNEVCIIDGHRIDILLSIDTLEEILRVSVYYFLDKKLFSLTCHFPFISTDEIEMMMMLINEKYNLGLSQVSNEFTRISGTNDVVIYLNHFVSVSCEYIHASRENHSLISSMYHYRKEQEEESLNRRRESILMKL